MSKSLKYLRIAFSAFSGLACVLLVVLWARSYWYADTFDSPLSRSKWVSLASYKGQLFLIDYEEPFPIANWGWNINEDPEGTLEMLLPIDAHCGVNAISFSLVGPTDLRCAFFPHWAFILLVAFLSLVPWLPGRFSLRALLIVTTVVAVAIGAIVAVSR